MQYSYFKKRFQTNVSQLLHFSKKVVLFDIKPKASSLDFNRAKIHIVQCNFSLILLYCNVCVRYCVDNMDDTDGKRKKIKSNKELFVLK